MNNKLPKKIKFFHFETTGVNLETDEIIEVSIMELKRKENALNNETIDFSDYRPFNSNNYYVNRERELEDIIRKITGVDEKFLSENGLSPEDNFEMLRDFHEDNDSDTLLIDINIPFGLNFLESEFRKRNIPFELKANILDLGTVYKDNYERETGITHSFQSMLYVLGFKDKVTKVGESDNVTGASTKNIYYKRILEKIMEDKNVDLLDYKNIISVNGKYDNEMTVMPHVNVIPVNTKGGFRELQGNIRPITPKQARFLKQNRHYLEAEGILLNEVNELDFKTASRLVEDLIKDPIINTLDEVITITNGEKAQKWLKSDLKDYVKAYLTTNDSKEKTGAIIQMERVAVGLIKDESEIVIKEGVKKDLVTDYNNKKVYKDITYHFFKKEDNSLGKLSANEFYDYRRLKESLTLLKVRQVAERNGLIKEEVVRKKEDLTDFKNNNESKIDSNTRIMLEREDLKEEFNDGFEVLR